MLDEAVIIWVINTILFGLAEFVCIDVYYSGYYSTATCSLSGLLAS